MNPPHLRADEQLPRVYGPRLPGAVRGGLRRWANRLSRDDQEHRVLDHREGFRGGLGGASHPIVQNGDERRRRWVRTCRACGRGLLEPAWAQGTFLQ